MAKQEQVLIIEPQHELKFRGKLGNACFKLPPMYLSADYWPSLLAHGQAPKFEVLFKDW
jgi:hypothetical protein